MTPAEEFEAWRQQSAEATARTVARLKASGNALRDCCISMDERADKRSRIEARDREYAEMAAAGWTKRADGVWFPPAGVGLGPASSVYADHDNGFTLD